MTPQTVIAAARRHIGTPWVHQGRLPGRALDCAGLVICVARELGLVPPGWDVNGYSAAPDGSMLSVCRTHLHELPAVPGAIEPGAVLVVRTFRDPQHLGFAVPHPLQAERPGLWNIVHACQHSGRVVETRLMLRHTFALAGVYRLPGLQPSAGV